MTSLPPHLPHKSCSVNSHNLRCRLWNLFVIVLVSLMSGIVGALFVYNLLDPSFESGEKVYLINRQSTDEDVSTWSKPPNDLAASRLSYSTINIFDKTQKVSETFYPGEAFVGHLVVLSSNGWAVVYEPQFTPDILNRWDLIDSHGEKQSINTYLFDSDRGMLYIKLVGTNFRSASFPNWDELRNGSNVWVSDYNVWKQRILGDTIVVVDEPHNINTEYSQLRLEPSVEAGGVVMTEEGEFIGFVDEDGLLETLWYSQFELPHLLETEELLTSRINWQGYFVESFGSAENHFVSTSGFYVSNPGSYAGGIKRGDVITHIDGKEVTPHNIWKQILQAPEEFKVTLWNNSGEVDILVVK